MIQDFTTITPLSADGQIVKQEGFFYQNNIPILEQNYIDRMNANNGWSQKRLFRKIASVPYLEVLNATQQGYDMDDPDDVYRFLGEHPDYLTVDKIYTGRDPRVIVK